MIYGIGTDIVAVARLSRLFERHGEAALDHLLMESERAGFKDSSDKGRFLAKRFAAKEALAKALGTGLRAPATLTTIAVTHDSRGKPEFELAPDLASLLRSLGLTPHLSLSDEKDYVVAFVVLEQK